MLQIPAEELEIPKGFWDVNMSSSDSCSSSPSTPRKNNGFFKNKKTFSRFKFNNIFLSTQSVVYESESLLLSREKVFLTNDHELDCWTITVINELGKRELWFEGGDIAKFFNYTKTENMIKKVVHPEWVKPFSYFGIDPSKIPIIMKCSTLFVYLNGLCDIVERSNKPMAQQLRRMVKPQQLLLEKDDLIIDLVNKNKQKDNLIIDLVNQNKQKDDLIIDLVNQNKQKDDLMKQILVEGKFLVLNEFHLRKQLRHVFRLLRRKSEDSEKEYVFARCQKSNLAKSMRRVNEKDVVYEILIHAEEVPNPINILPKLKEYLKKKIQVEYKCNSNRLITIYPDVQKIIMELIKDYIVFAKE